MIQENQLYKILNRATNKILEAHQPEKPPAQLRLTAVEMESPYQKFFLEKEEGSYVITTEKEEIVVEANKEFGTVCLN